MKPQLTVCAKCGAIMEKKGTVIASIMRPGVSIYQCPKCKNIDLYSD